MCGPKFCAMKITEDVRALADAQAGLATKAAEFKAGGGELYVPRK
jgi:phosphomethylpyrimidine synthase